MNYNPAILAYVPPPAFGCARAFLENIRMFKTKWPLVLYSDHDYGEGFVKLRGRPEDARIPDKRFAVNNWCFITGLRIALKNNYSHILYLESDCRVKGDLWDKAIFDDYFDLPAPCPAAGTTVVWNPCSDGLESMRRWERLIVEHNGESLQERRSNMPIATYGFKRSDEKGGTCVFPNGAGGIYDMAWMPKLFDLRDGMSKETAQKITAWDQALGFLLWEVLGIRSYDAVGYLRTVYSGYGEVITTEAMRREMLRSGRVRLIHQYKTNDTGLEESYERKQDGSY